MPASSPVFDASHWLAQRFTWREAAERCRRLAVRTLSLSGKLPPESDEPFLYGQLQDTLQQLDVIIRVIQGEFDDDDGDAGLPHSGRSDGGLFSRLKNALTRRSKRPGSTPRLFVPQQGLQGNSWTIPLPDLVGFLASAAGIVASFLVPGQ